MLGYIRNSFPCRRDTPETETDSDTDFETKTGTNWFNTTNTPASQ